MAEEKKQGASAGMHWTGRRAPPRPWWEASLKEGRRALRASFEGLGESKRCEEAARAGGDIVCGGAAFRVELAGVEVGVMGCWSVHASESEDGSMELELFATPSLLVFDPEDRTKSVFTERWVKAGRCKSFSEVEAAGPALARKAMCAAAKSLMARAEFLAAKDRAALRAALPEGDAAPAKDRRL